MRYYLTALLAVLTVAVFASTATAASASSCRPFVNPAKVTAFARAKLVYIGFHPNIDFQCYASERYIHIEGVRDGVDYTGAIEKLGPRRIRIGITEHPRYAPGRHLWTSSAMYDLRFYA
jgi:hypothetical protein